MSTFEGKTRSLRKSFTKTIMRRAGRPALSPPGQQVLNPYERQLRTAEDLTAATIRNYLSDLSHFAAWYESRCSVRREEALAFRTEAITTPTITDYRAYLQQTLRHRFGYWMAASVPLHRLAQLMGHDSLDTTMRYVQATTHELQQDIERIAWR